MAALPAISVNTYRETVRNPAFFVLIAICALFLVISPEITMFALGEERKMLIDIILSTITFQGLFIAITASSIALSDEIESKTILMTLSKPVSRAGYIFFKYIGLILSLLLSILILISISINVILFYSDDISIGYFALYISPILVMIAGSYLANRWLRLPVEFAFVLAGLIPAIIFIYLASLFAEREGIQYIFPFIQGGALIFLQISVVTAVAVALATRFPLTVNAMITSIVFLAGHMFGALMQTGDSVSGFWHKAAYYGAPLPRFSNFNFMDTISAGAAVPGAALVQGAACGAGASVIFLLLAVALFSNREVG